LIYWIKFRVLKGSSSVVAAD